MKRPIFTFLYNQPIVQPVFMRIIGTMEGNEADRPPRGSGSYRRIDMSNFTTLKDLPAAKKSLKAAGFKVSKEKMTLNGRPAYRVVSEDKVTDITVTDYGLLDWANC